MIVLDASVLLAFFDAENEHHAASVVLLEVNDTLGVSSLTLGEILVAPARTGQLDETRAALRDLDIVELCVPANVGVRLARLCAATGLPVRDCWALLAAEDAGAAIASFDDRLIRAAAGTSQRIVDLPAPAPIVIPEVRREPAGDGHNLRIRNVLRRNIR